MEYITTTIGILGFIGILYGLVKMFGESGYEWENRPMKSLMDYGPFDLDLDNPYRDDY